MKCKDTRNVLSRYLDHEMCSTERVSVEEHLAQCASCQSEYELQQRLWAALGRVDPIRSPDLMAAIDARLSEPQGWDSILAGLRLRSIGYVTATAALVALFVWTGVWAGTARHASDALVHDRTFTELMSDAPPGMEVVVVLEQLGARP